jgi:hypothetical protein
MESTERSWLFWPLVQALGREAEVSRGVPRETVSAAKRAVAVRFADLTAAHLDGVARQRIAAYFWGVIRRRALRQAPSYARRIVRATLAADLADAGWDSSSIDVELARCGLSA